MGDLPVSPEMPRIRASRMILFITIKSARLFSRIVLIIKNIISERSLPSRTRIPRPVRAHGRAKSRLTGSSGPTEVLALLEIDSIYRNSNQEAKKVVSRAIREKEHACKKDTQNLRRENEQRTRELQTEKKNREQVQVALEQEKLRREREREEMLADSSRKSLRIKDLEKRLKKEREQKIEAENLNTKAQAEVYQLERALRDQKQMERDNITLQEKIETLSKKVTEEKERNKEEIRKKGVLEVEKLGLQEELKHLQEKYGEEQTRANNLMRDYAQALQDNEALHRRNADNEAENNALRVQNEELERKYAEQEGSIKQLQAVHGHIQQEHDQLRASYSSLEEQQLVLTRTHAELQNRKELLKARYARVIVSLTSCLREWQNGDHNGIRRTRVQEPAFVRRKSEMTL